jgi:hypothetical protein
MARNASAGTVTGGSCWGPQIIWSNSGDQGLPVPPEIGAVFLVALHWRESHSLNDHVSTRSGHLEGFGAPLTAPRISPNWIDELRRRCRATWNCDRDSQQEARGGPSPVTATETYPGVSMIVHPFASRRRQRVAPAASELTIRSFNERTLQSRRVCL